ncbi:MAG TPA: hypothetical protein VFQ25_08730 [Ktedonobacterales bacterium]|nr:hypothetical protein [Ktedonobacterales bacterium]
MRAWGFLKNRAAVASLGAVLVFSLGAALAVLQLTHHVAPTGQASTASAATETATTSAAATAAAGGSGANATATTEVTATTLSPTPTTQRQPTPTGGAGQPFHQTGKVISVSNDTESFTMQVGTATYTVVVVTSGTPKTEIQINGTAQPDLTNLQAGMQANVEGEWRSDGKILAFSVDASSGGGGD